MKRAFLSAIIMFLAAPLVAHATPGDIGCQAKHEGREVSVTVWREAGGVMTNLIVGIDGLDIAHLAPVEQGMENVGTDDEPFMNSTISAAVDENSAKLRFPEQDPNSPDLIVFATIQIPKAQLGVKELQMSCQF